MACGSVYASEGSLGSAPRDLAARDPAITHDLGPHTQSPPRPSVSYRMDGHVHEAIRFLQAEHETVLSGLHKEMKLLQRRCDDMQFEAHLRHVTEAGEEALRQRVEELTMVVKERTQRAAQLEEELAAQQQRVQEAEEQHRWRELQLQKQVEAGERRVAELRGEVNKLRAQVRDLRSYSNALRTVGGPAPTPRSVSRIASSAALPPARPLSRSSRASVGSQESLESSGPRSLGSEDGEAGTWREARLGGASLAGRAPRAGRTPTSPTHRGTVFSLPPAMSSPPPSLPSLASLPPQRPSSTTTVVLPPITKTQSVTRQVRRQMRLSSAPVLDVERKDPGTPHRDPA